jgi:hypothetical protein
MFERVSKRASSSISSSESRTGVNLGTDLNRDPVYLSGKIGPSAAFAEAMLALGRVVKIQKPAKKDNSAYQMWVEAEYLRILNDRMPEKLQQVSDLTQTIAELKVKRTEFETKLAALTNANFFASARDKYFKWLLEHDRETWYILDPIVSVQVDGTFFEAFSRDESIYARVFLPHSAIQSSDQPSMGTTNIDYSLLLEREFDRVRSYRPMEIKVGLKSVDFITEAAAVEEAKIPLPESWVRGLVEVQSVQSLAPVTFELSPDSLADVIARLNSEREKTGPRSLKFILQPGKPIRIEIEPWGEIYADDWLTYSGPTSTEIRIWGRRRLAVLEDILINADSVKVSLLGSGMPSFWTVVKDNIELTIGLSGWSANDWASKAKFSGFIPVSDVEQKDLDKGVETLTKLGQVSTEVLAKELSVSRAKAAGVLQKLCLLGKAMFDPERNVYRWRDLFPTLDLYVDNESSREVRAGVIIAQQRSIVKTLDETKAEIRYLSATIEVESDTYTTMMELDLDYRPKYAQCNCPFYRHNKLKQGPCRHMVALSLIGEM